MILPRLSELQEDLEQIERMNVLLEEYQTLIQVMPDEFDKVLQEMHYVSEGRDFTIAYVPDSTKNITDSTALLSKIVTSIRYFYTEKSKESDQSFLQTYDEYKSALSNAAIHMRNSTEAFLSNHRLMDRIFQELSVKDSSEVTQSQLERMKHTIEKYEHAGNVFLSANNILRELLSKRISNADHF